MWWIKSENLVVISEKRATKRPWSEVLENTAVGLVSNSADVTELNLGVSRWFISPAELPAVRGESEGPDLTSMLPVCCISTVCLRVLEVLLSSQGGSHPSTELRFRERPALTCTGEGRHVLWNRCSRKGKWSQMRLFYFSNLPQSICPSANRLIKPLETLSVQVEQGYVQLWAGDAAVQHVNLQLVVKNRFILLI